MSICAKTLVSWLVMFPLVAAAQDAEQVFFRAYYLEVEQGKLEAALDLYQEVAKSPGASAELKERAAKRIAILREDLQARDLPRLLPSDALAYLEVRKLGAHLGDLLKMMGFTGGSPAGKEAEDAERGGELSISPKLVEGLKGLEGAALAITEFDMERGIPQGVVIVNLGGSPAIGGAVETALSAAAESGVLRPGDPVRGHPAYTGPFGTVVLTERLLIAGSPHERAVEAVKRLEGAEAPAQSPSEAFTELKAEREDSLIFAQVDARKIVALAKDAMSRGGETPQEFQIAQALLDLESLRWAALRVGTGDRTLRADLWVRLAEENHCIAYQLLRTPPLDRAALKSVPPGAAAVLALALSETAGEGEAPSRARSEAARTITGLDLGREIFSNVRTVLAFALPPAAPIEQGDGPPLPQVGIEFLVKDPARSSALWSELLRVLAIVLKADAQPARTESVAGRDVSVYAFPGAIRINLAALPDRVILTLGEPAMAQVLRAAGAGGAVAEDADLAAMLAGASGKESKLLLLNGARLAEVARPLGLFRGPDGAQMAGVFEKSGLTFATTESSSKFQVSLSVKVPELAPLIRQMMRGGPSHARRDGGGNATSSSRKAKAPKALKPPKQGPSGNPGSEPASPGFKEPETPPAVPERPKD